VDPRDPWPKEKVITEDLMPQLVHHRDFRKESMSPDIETKIFIADRLRYSTNLPASLKKG
jgi:hypothetical protein